MIEPRLASILVTAIAISLAVTPLISNFGHKLAVQLRRGPSDKKMAGDDAPVVIIGILHELSPLVKERLPKIPRVIALPGA